MNNESLRFLSNYLKNRIGLNRKLDGKIVVIQKALQTW